MFAIIVIYYNVCVRNCMCVCLFVLGTTLYRHFSLLWNPSLEKLIIIIIIIIIIKIIIIMKL